MKDFLKNNSWVVCILGLIATVDLALSAYFSVKAKSIEDRGVGMHANLGMENMHAPTDPFKVV